MFWLYYTCAAWASGWFASLVTAILVVTIYPISQIREAFAVCRPARLPPLLLFDCTQAPRERPQGHLED